jgi:hypothetical protein
MRFGIPADPLLLWPIGLKRLILASKRNDREVFEFHIVVLVFSCSFLKIFLDLHVEK